MLDLGVDGEKGRANDKKKEITPGAYTSREKSAVFLQKLGKRYRLYI
jgi:hypothetical protein